MVEGRERVSDSCKISYQPPMSEGKSELFIFQAPFFTVQSLCRWVKPPSDLPRELLVAFDLVKKQRTVPESWECWQNGSSSWDFYE